MRAMAVPGCALGNARSPSNLQETTKIMAKIKQIITLGALSYMASTSFAQNSVTVYGLLDAGVEHVNHVGASKSSLTRMPKSTNSAPSRLGFRGVEDLGNGYKAFFNLEQGIVVANGSIGQGGRGFGRLANVGLTGDFGALTLGRQNTMTFWAGTDSDVMGGGIYGPGSLDSYIPNSRADNALGWMKSFGNGLQLGATYSFGRDAVKEGPNGTPAATGCAGEVAGDSKACRAWSLLVKYNTKAWGMAFSNDRLHGSDKGGVFGGMNRSNATDNRAYLTGWFMLDKAKIGAGIMHRKNDGNPANSRSNLWYLGASYPLTEALQLSGQYASLRYSENSKFNAALTAVRLTYTLSKRTAVFGQVGNMHNSELSNTQVSAGSPGSNPLAGVNQTGINVGIRHNF